jgi:hypothetical protein
MFIITGDASGQAGDTRSEERYMNDFWYIKQELEKYNDISFMFKVPNKNPFVYDRVTNTNNEYEKKTADVCDNCTKTIEDRKLVKWKTGGEGFHLDKSDKKRTHHSDNADYAIYNSIPYRSKDFKEDGTEVPDEPTAIFRPQRH